MFTFLTVENNASTFLATTVNATALSFVLVNSSQLPTSYPYHLSIDNEIVEVTNNNVSTNTLTVVRAQESTVAAGHTAGASIGLRITAQIITDMYTAINSIQTVALETNGTPNGDQALLNLVEGSNITIADNGLGSVTISASGGGGTPGGSNTDVQFNNDGSFGGNGNFVTDGSGNTILAGYLESSGLVVAGASSVSLNHNGVIEYLDPDMRFSLPSTESYYWYNQGRGTHLLMKIDGNSGLLYSPGAIGSISDSTISTDTNARQLVADVTTPLKIDWSGTQNISAVISFDNFSYDIYLAANIRDNSGILSINPYQRQLVASDGSTLMVDYSNTLNNSSVLSFASGFAHFANPVYGNSFYSTATDTGFTITQNLTGGSHGFDAAAMSTPGTYPFISNNFNVDYLGNITANTITNAGGMTATAGVVTAGSFSGSGANLTGVPYSSLSGAPTNVSAFVNDAGYVTPTTLSGNISQLTNNSGYITTNGGNNTANISQWTNDSGYLLGTAFNYSGVLSASLGGNIIIANGAVTGFTAAS